MKQDSYDLFFANFSNYTRIRIISSLADGELSVSEIVEKVDGEQSNISHHLASMVKCNVLNVRREGKKRIYGLNEETVKPMLKLAEEHVFNACGNCDGDCRTCMEVIR
jgi:DNA-binding transcriptional ArsR family regulator